MNTTNSSISGMNNMPFKAPQPTGAKQQSQEEKKEGTAAATIKKGGLLDNLFKQATSKNDKAQLMKVPGVASSPSNAKVDGAY
jgi:hypothetical protein